MNMWMMYLVLKLDDIVQAAQVLSVIALILLGIGLAIMLFVVCVAE